MLLNNRPASLLIVDDSETTRATLSRRLKSEGFEVATADDGERAMEWLAHHGVDAVLLDIQMPGISGLEVLRILRQTHSRTQLPIVIVTGDTSSDAVVQALTLGANDLVSKPIDFPVTLARIRTQLSLKWAEEALRESEERYALAARGSNHGLWDYDLLNDKVYYSPRWKSMLGWEDGEIGTDPEEWFGRIHAEEVDRVEEELQAHIDGHTAHFEVECRMLHRDGTYRWMLTRGIALRDPSNQAYRMAGSQTDITLGKVADALTGLPNRILFADRLNRCLERSKKHPDYSFAVIFMDLDGFKLLNDSLGHVLGDQVLVSIARRLEDCLRSADLVARFGARQTVARLGGDEFTILLDNIHTAQDGPAVAERIRAVLSKPFSLRGQEIFLTASLGIAVSTAEYEHAEDLIRDADTAMYRAKMRGKDCYEVFDSKMRADNLVRLQLETDLRGAVERQEFRVYYQPIICVQTGRVESFEALVRWQHPLRGLIFPGEFIPVAEDTGLLVEMEDFVMRECSQQVRLWQERYPTNPPLRIGINLSSKHFVQPDLKAQCESILHESGLDPSSLIVEITESTVVPRPDLAASIMAELKALNIQISIDDFGTGYSSLSYLQRFPFDSLKMDASFVRRMDSSESSMEIVRTIVVLAHNLNLKVVAEGVETLEQFATLRELGCEMVQGYLFAKALPAGDAEALLSGEPPWMELFTGGSLMTRIRRVFRGAFGVDRQQLQ